jgi:hypothetical protein
VSSTPDTAGEVTCGLVQAAAGFGCDPLQLALAKTIAVTKSARHPARILAIMVNAPDKPTVRPNHPPDETGAEASLDSLL